MDKYTKHKAHYQLCSFIGSKKAYDFDLIAEDLAILFMISRYLDMPDGFCRIKQITLAKECFMSESTLRRRCNYLVSQKILFRYMKGKLYCYELGEAITGIEQY